MAFQHLDMTQAPEVLADDAAVCVDIRDPNSFALGRIPGSLHLDNDSIRDFLAQTPRESIVVVCCYHGISSQSAAEFLSEQGFAKVFSLSGGFEQWASQYPEQVERD